MTAQCDLAQARLVLENSETYELLPRHANLRVAAQLWLYPMFTPAMSWTVPVPQSALLVRRIVWNPSYAAPALHGFFGSEARLTWWQEAPAGWEGVAQWHAEAVALFQSVLPQSSV